jgi:hypothetical protein
MSQGSIRDIIVMRNENGEILTVDDQSNELTYEGLKEICSRKPKEIKESSTRDKLLWFKRKIEKSTVHFTQGCNEIIVSRDNLL